jgi:hypothetical protein
MCYLVGLYKVAMGENIEDAEKPGMFDLKVHTHTYPLLFSF